MVYKAVYTNAAQRDLNRIPHNDASRILKKIDIFLRFPDPLIKAKKLKGFENDTYRFRVGDYRIIFRKDATTNKLVVLVILKIVQRKDAYK